MSTTVKENARTTLTKQRVKIGNYHLALNYKGENLDYDYYMNSVRYYEDVIGFDFVENNYDMSKLTASEIELLCNAIGAFAEQLDLTDEQREYYDELARDEFAGEAGLDYGEGGWEDKTE